MRRLLTNDTHFTTGQFEIQTLRGNAHILQKNQQNSEYLEKRSIALNVH